MTKQRAKELLDAKELLMTAKAQIGKQRRKTLCGSAKQLLDAKQLHLNNRLRANS